MTGILRRELEWFAPLDHADHVLMMGFHPSSSVNYTSFEEARVDDLFLTYADQAPRHCPISVRSSTRL